MELRPDVNSTLLSANLGKHKEKSSFKCVLRWQPWEVHTDPSSSHSLSSDLQGTQREPETQATLELHLGHHLSACSSN